MAFTNSAEGGSHGTTCTTGNTGGGSGTAASTVAIDTTNSGDIEFSTLAARYGALGYRFVNPASGAAAHRMLFPHGSAVAGRYAIYAAVRFSNVPSAIEDVMHIRHSGGNCGNLIVAADGKLQLADAAGSTIAASKATNALQADHWYGICMSRTKGTGTGDGQLGYAYYDLEAGGTLIESYNNAACNAGTADTTHGAFGRTTGRTQSRNVDYDDLRGDALASGYMTPVASAPTVTTYDDHVFFEVDDGTAPFGVTQTGGTSVTAVVIDNGATSGKGVFAIPRHATDVTTWTVTDDNSETVTGLTVDPTAVSSNWPKWWNGTAWVPV